MCKYPDYIETAVRRLNDFLPMEMKVKDLDVQIRGMIPFGLNSAFDYYEADIMGESFILAGSDDDGDDLPSTQLSNQRDILVQKTGMTPIFIFNKIESYNLPRYAKKNLNIVVGAKQLFLPSLFLIVSKEKPNPVKKDERPPIFFQLMTLYHLQKENLDGLTTKELAERLNSSYATVNRGLRWMKEKGIIQLGEGKEKRVSFRFNGRALWDETLEYMQSPVETIVYTPRKVNADRSCLSGLNALAEYSLINGGPNRIAISKEVYKTLKEQDVDLIPIGEYGIEVWKYDPALLAENGVIDRLSLYLVLKDHDDERVQIELDNMMNEIKW